LARKAAAKKSKEVDDYRHEEAGRPNNPACRLAWQDTQKFTKHRYEYDPHLGRAPR
jgi:hypothetical protein